MEVTKGGDRYMNFNMFIISSVMLFSDYFSLQIQWDEPTTIQRPERVSPWDVEPFLASASLNLTQQPVKIKRPRPLDLPVAGR